jgi:hypothetical protein
MWTPGRGLLRKLVVAHALPAYAAFEHLALRLLPWLPRKFLAAALWTLTKDAANADSHYTLPIR